MLGRKTQVWVASGVLPTSQRLRVPALGAERDALAGVCHADTTSSNLNSFDGSRLIMKADRSVW